jgi:hypothetical protein
MCVPFVYKSWENFYRRVEASRKAALGIAPPTPGLCIVNLCIIILKKNILFFGYVRGNIIYILFYSTFKRSIKKLLLSV